MGKQVTKQIHTEQMKNFSRREDVVMSLSPWGKNLAPLREVEGMVYYAGRLRGVACPKV